MTNHMACRDHEYSCYVKLNPTPEAPNSWTFLSTELLAPSAFLILCRLFLLLWLLIENEH